ncbi:MAG: IS3 family transposase [Acidipropionibacterium sp.]|jgi:transposase InsO family protein|nr:IS3 family transposase [Acidipropionibacterium sp.]
MTVTKACALTGMARSTYYRISRGYQSYRPAAHPIAQADRDQPAALSQEEREQVIAVLSDPAFEEHSVCQSYWRAFDRGLVACSMSTFYRIAAVQGLSGDRRRGRHSGQSPRRTPRVAASGVGQLWSWDITDLKGPDRQVYKLYLVIDVFPRYPVAWRVETGEDHQLAIEMFTTAFTRYGAPAVLHADNGAVMRCHDLLDALAEQEVTASFSRPRVCDDNPFSESLFKTLKYDLDCPERFDSLDAARAWVGAYLEGYATEHRHSGIGWHTPASVFDGTCQRQQAWRQDRLDRCYRQHPERFRRPPRAPRIPTHVGINQKKNTTTDLSQTG